jgi:uncharacterized protein YgiM (DUF1202 family)
MALISCSQCSKQISSFTTACPACGAPPPQLNAVPPPLPTELRAANGTDPRIIAIAAVVVLLPLLAVLGRMAKEPQSTAPSVASPSPRFTATPAEHFPRAMPVPTPALATYQVVKNCDYLNLRTGAGSKYPVIMKLDPGTGRIVLGAKRVPNGETMWQEIIVNGRTGWVNADYIAPAPQSSASP